VSHTSTERTRTDARFRRAFGLTIVALLVLCGLFLGLGYLQGPKLSSAQVDTTGVINQTGQQLRLFANQAIADVTADQVTLSPETPFTVSTSGDIVAVQFTDRLRYATEYTVSVNGVTSPSGGAGGTLRYSFTTDSPQLYYLDRGDPLDEIVRTTAAGDTRESVYSAVGIQSFVALGKALVVTTIDGETSALDLVSLTDPGVAQRLDVPAVGFIEGLAAATSGTEIGFMILDEGATAGTPLYWRDLEKSGQANPVTGLDGSPLRALGWRFVPGTSSMLVLTGDKSLLLIDPQGGTVVPLGQFQTLLDVSPDGATAIVTDAVGALTLTLATGDQQRLELPAIDAQTQVFLGAISRVADGSVLATAVLAPEYVTAVLRFDETTTSVLYRTVQDAGSIQSFTASPNGQYVAIETVPDIAVSTSDGYVADARSTSTTTVIVDLGSGAVVSSFTGFGLAW